jgi:hypothetical protein
MIKFIADVALVSLILLAVTLCFIMPIIVYAAIKDLKNRGAK